MSLVDEIEIRRATVDDIRGVAKSGAAQFAEDGATRDRLRNPEWPGKYGTHWCADLLADPAAFIVCSLVEVAGDGRGVVAGAPHIVHRVAGTEIADAGAAQRSDRQRATRGGEGEHVRQDAAQGERLW